VEVPLAVPLLAVNVTFCAIPGVSFTDPGFAVTPAGNPVIPTETGAVKPLTGVACTESAVPVDPTTNVCEAGVTVKEKSASGAAVVVSATVALWLSVPEVPVSVTVAEEAATVASAVKVTFCATPAARVSVPGFAVTPAGSPLSATATGALNPFSALAVTLTDWPGAPPVSEAVVGEALRVKSGVGVVAGMRVPPQPTMIPVIVTTRVTKSEPGSRCLRIASPPRGPSSPHMQNRADELWMDIIPL
jgi:hypothetical protein